MPAHVVYSPEWVIEADGGGSFRVECECGWVDDGFDTASSARAAGFVHSTGAPPPGGRSAGTGPGTGTGANAAAAPPRRRWWRR